MIALLAALTLPQAVAAYEAGRLGEAQAALAAIAVEQPASPEALTWLGAAQMENGGDFPGAERTLRKAVELAPRYWRAHMLLGVAVARQIGDASLFRKLSMASEMEKELQRAVRLAPGSVPAHEALLEYYRHAPEIVGGGKDKARRQADRIARLDSFAGLLAHGRIENDFRAAAREARTGKQLAALARASRDRGAFAAALEARPDDPSLHAESGEAQLAADDALAAVGSFRRAAALDPLLAAAWWGLARALEKSGQRVEARAAYQRFSEVAPRHAKVAEAGRRASSMG